MGLSGHGVAYIRDPRAIMEASFEAIRRETDMEERIPLWHTFHRRLYELQPYLFMNAPPRKIAINKKLHGAKMYLFPPGFKLRDLYYAEGTPGTRPISN